MSAFFWKIPLEVRPSWRSVGQFVWKGTCKQNTDDIRLMVDSSMKGMFRG